MIYIEGKVQACIEAVNKQISEVNPTSPHDSVDRIELNRRYLELGKACYQAYLDNKARVEDAIRRDAQF